MDPIRFGAGSVNLYRYVGNRSGLFTDPLGLYEIIGFTSGKGWALVSIEYTGSVPMQSGQATGIGFGDIIRGIWKATVDVKCCPDSPKIKSAKRIFSADRNVAWITQDPTSGPLEAPAPKNIWAAAGELLGKLLEKGIEKAAQKSLYKVPAAKASQKDKDELSAAAPTSPEQGDWENGDPCLGE